MNESEDEDFESAATKRVNEAITSILNEEEGDEMDGKYIPPDKISVYFRYTDEGAIREDPEEAAKKEKNKKKRLQSGKRPITGKKRKVDMVSGDIEKMVQQMTSSQAAEKSAKSKKKIFPKSQGLV